MTTGQQITDEEAAILRAWLGGALLTEIAKARRVEHADVARVIVDTCGTNRQVARAWLEGGPRPSATTPNAHPGTPGLSSITTADPDRSGSRTRKPDRQNGAVTDASLSPEPLARWNIHRCPDCRYLGPAGEHAADCAGELQPVVLLLLPAPPEE